MATKKSGKAKSGVQKLQIKKQTLRDLDAKKARDVRGGNKSGGSSRRPRSTSVDPRVRQSIPGRREPAWRRALEPGMP